MFEKHLRGTLLFLILSIPLDLRFVETMYYFNVNYAGFSEEEVSYISSFKSFSFLLGTTLYGRYFINQEFRTALILCQVMNLLNQLSNLTYTTRLNTYLGIPDIWMLVFSGFFMEALIFAFSMLPLMVLMAKVTPPKVEATIFAFLTSTKNMHGVLGSLVSAAIISSLGINNEHMDRLYLFVLVQISVVWIPLILVLVFIPTKAEVKYI